MFKYMLTLLACAAMLYQTYAEAASKSRPIRSKPKVEIAQHDKIHFFILPFPFLIDFIYYYLPLRMPTINFQKECVNEWNF